MLQVSQLFIYPIKSLGGISVSEAEITDRGFKHDRRWMLIDKNDRFLSQREFAQMALLTVEINDNELVVSHKHELQKKLNIPIVPKTNQSIFASVWDDQFETIRVDPEADKWFSMMLGFDCRLVYMPDETHRAVDERYAINYDEITSLSDAYPFLLISEASLEDLNNKLAEKLPMDRFRPNIVIKGAFPFQEDEMEEFSINGISFFGVKPCARCIVTTINQDNAQKGKEPLKTLSSYRLKGHKILFGQNLLHGGLGKIAVADQIAIVKEKEPVLPNI
ncbi:MOSC domain-containing protein [Pedobacter sp. HMF7647]|uniref:MOSC domain-containing protein n=1 Tax=Hufsiella arboris TaxID=2695275 RepID=A0A7K1Y591_9SPHI|nr:MOSC N-terminal beta barrel domain-containing protein [Hufsiella arboris]MXV49752.1 MOSC domain-containing protein [Hufsiella arboris]